MFHGKTVSGVSLLACTIAISAQATQETTPIEPRPAQATVKFGSKLDWVELDSGEWLGGTVEGMNNGKLRFHSQRVGDQTLGWADIERIRSREPLRVLLADGRDVHGWVEIHGNKVTIQTLKGPVTVDRWDVLIIAPEGKSELDHWHVSLSVGANFQSGNNQQIAYKASAKVTRWDVHTRLDVDYEGNYEKNQGELTSSSQLVSATFDYFLTKLWFIRCALGEYYYNPFQNIANEVTAGTGVGLQFYRKPDFSWDVVLGPGYQYTDFESVVPGTGSEVSSPTGILSTAVNSKPFSGFKLSGDYQAVLSSERAGLWTSHLSAKTSYKVVSIFNVNASFQWSFIENPMTDSDGVVPEQSDYTFALGVGVDYN